MFFFDMIEYLSPEIKEILFWYIVAYFFLKIDDLCQFLYIYLA